MSWKPRPVRTSSRIAVSFAPSVGSGKSDCVTSCINKQICKQAVCYEKKNSMATTFARHIQA